PVYNERNEDNDLRELNRKYAGMYSEPLFQKMFEAAGSHSKTMLRTQYRMTSEIMGVINRFYGGALEMPEGVPEKEHRISAAGKTRPLIVPEHSVLFIDCRGRERMESGSTSFSNESEAETVFRMVRILDACCKYDSDGNPLEDPDRRMSMGVITPYSDQMKLIKKKLRMDAGAETDLRAFRNDGEERFMVKAVDDFQGDERDIIILSLVRTSASRFISDFRRINVAMSRARRLLIIVGNAGILEKTPVEIDGKQEYVYKDIISDLRLRGCFADSSEVVL
ncbi:MAG: C-terminal helicase domain-containing protein, partial [Candidatus Methanomethylophilaceae archaeon]|nr:C-terminal helicase domain-containing protein [Candidatus Methanomethylophilaceae archaeon]